MVRYFSNFLGLLAFLRKIPYSESRKTRSFFVRCFKCDDDHAKISIRLLGLSKQINVRIVVYERDGTEKRGYRL